MLAGLFPQLALVRPFMHVFSTVMVADAAAADNRRGDPSDRWAIPPEHRTADSVRRKWLRPAFGEFPGLSRRDRRRDMFLQRLGCFQPWFLPETYHNQVS